MNDMKKKDLKDGVFYTHVGVENDYEWSLQYNEKDSYHCSGYWGGKWRDKGWYFPDTEFNHVRESTLEELNDLGDEHLPYSKYLQKELGAELYNSDIIDEMFAGISEEEFEATAKQMREFSTGAKEEWEGILVTNDNGLKYIKKGGVRVFETGSVRSLNDGRERYDLVPQLALDVAADIFGKNIGSFGSGNHLEFCIPEKACIESLKRHLAAYTRSLEGYEEVNEDDAGSILTNALMLVHTIEMRKLGLYKVKYGN